MAALPYNITVVGGGGDGVGSGQASVAGGYGSGGVAGVSGQTVNRGALYGVVVPAQKFPDGSAVRVIDQDTDAFGVEGKVISYDPNGRIYYLQSATDIYGFYEYQLSMAADAASNVPVAPPPPDPPCIFCSAPSSGGEFSHGALRSQQVPYYLCAKSECYLALGYHRERITAGLVDCAETRQSTVKWVKGRSKRP
jgi:hypothetical protein